MNKSQATAMFASKTYNNSETHWCYWFFASMTSVDMFSKLQTILRAGKFDFGSTWWGLENTAQSRLPWNTSELVPTLIAHTHQHYEPM